MNRFDALKDLVAFNKPVSVLSASLSKFDWDYEGQLLTVMASQVQEVLKRFLAGKYSVQELEGWANLIECREDLEFEEKKHEEIANVIYCLANPVLEGEITADSCKALITSLDCSDD
ncbi:hypothetical protein [Cellvibrio japonicus]|uniref:hypothetical protein n=1 Tax=Cellvibrio japonicus TaxID=155077 RepID=UPI0005A1655B|nr:hypothetical protein [Cellvibrio japonicus]QEI11818.1 hypothetical protein FY117_05940 [Cellvibrio japonicus]QEI15392.1 hypothetical protein FY116_05940 [Cellvibrio japonicus]QEI18971.1 hypothetical protein FY115_05940 [Cellvibrio japonicus]